MVKRPGWHNESARHSLASRGIRTGMGARGHYHISENRCRNCGRLNCEGGASCEIATELRNGHETSLELQGSTDRPRIEEFIEGHMFLTHPNWVCALEENNIHLGLYIEMIDASEHGFDPEDYDEEYPILLNSIVMVVPEESHPEFMDDVQESIGCDDIEPTAFDVAQYMGGVQASHAIEGVTSAAKSDVPSRTITDRNGRESRWFKNTEEAEEYVKDVYVHDAHAVFMLIGFLLDQPINMVGNDGWDMIRQQKENENWSGKW